MNELINKKCGDKTYYSYYHVYRCTYHRSVYRFRIVKTMGADESAEVYPAAGEK